MLPGIRLIQQMRAEQDQAPPDALLEMAEEADGEPMEGEPAEQFRLGLRKKRSQALLKQMLANSGYGDLARATSISRQALPEEDEENVY